MSPSPQSTVSRSGLSGLAAILPPGKALTARRLVAAGRTPDEFEFDKQGQRLSPAEASAKAGAGNRI